MYVGGSIFVHPILLKASHLLECEGGHLGGHLGGQRVDMGWTASSHHPDRFATIQKLHQSAALEHRGNLS